MSGLTYLAPLLLLPPIILLSSPYTLPLWRTTSRPTSNLPFSPTLLSAVDITFLISLILLKSLLAALNLVPSLNPSADSAQTFALPELTLSAPLHISADDVKRYLHAARLPLKRTDRPTKGSARDAPLLLAPALSTPLMLILLANRKCPIRPLGAVNVRNRFEFREPKACADLAAVRELAATARIGGAGGEGRRAKRGVEFDVVVEVSGVLGGGGTEDGGARSVVFKQWITLLQMLPRRTKPVWAEGQGAQGGEEERPSGMLGLGEVRFAEQAPSAWAKVCCDYNPIHMSKVAARLFGFGGRIVHGNHVAAAVAEMCKDEIVAEAFGAGTVVESIVGGRSGWWMEVTFRRPMVLPLKMEVKGGTDDKGAVWWETERAGNLKVYVEGKMGLLG